MAAACPPGKIRRVSFTRTVKKTGKKVHVPSACVPAKSKTGKKTPKSKRILPKVGKETKLRKYGYALNKPALSRHRALRKASKKEGSLKVLRHLNLIRNFTPGVTEPANKAKFAKDVEYMSHLHAKETGRKSLRRAGLRRSHGKRARKSKSRSRSRK